MPTHPLAHLAFFAELAEQSEDTPAWAGVSAGLLVMRLYDSWIRQSRRHDPGLEPLRVAAVRAQVQSLPASLALRDPLLRLVDAMLVAPRDPDLVRERLLVVAARLQGDSQWRLAADVYRTYVETREPHDLSSSAQSAAFDGGYCYRMAGELDEATVAYDVGEAIATAARDTFGMLRARVCKAKLTAYRGNLPQAELELDATIRDAQAARCAPALSLALTDRMAVAGRRGQFEAAAVYGFRALQVCDDGRERERILSDIATALGDAGHRTASHDAHLVLSVTASEQSVAWLAMVNLLQLAIADGREEVFERYRAALADASLPAELGATYHLLTGDGHRRFGRLELAERAYREALRLAEAHQVNEVVLRAEYALRSLPTTLPVPPAAPEGVTIEDVIRAMGELRRQTVTR